MPGRRVSAELIAGLVVVLAGISGGTYFYLRGESPVQLVCALKDIPTGASITADSVQLTTAKRGEIADWFKSEKDADPVAINQSYYLQTIPAVVGQKSNGIIQKEQFIYRRGINAGGDLYGAYLLSHHYRRPYIK